MSKNKLRTVGARLSRWLDDDDEFFRLQSGIQTRGQCQLVAESELSAVSQSLSQSTKCH